MALVYLMEKTEFYMPRSSNMINIYKLHGINKNSILKMKWNQNNNNNKKVIFLPHAIHSFGQIKHSFFWLNQRKKNWYLKIKNTNIILIKSFTNGVLYCFCFFCFSHKVTNRKVQRPSYTFLNDNLNLRFVCEKKKKKLEKFSSPHMISMDIVIRVVFSRVFFGF